VVSSNSAADPARNAVTTALNAVAGVNARSSFRIRPSTWARADGASVGGDAWIVGELDYRIRKELAWTAGAEAQVIVLAPDGAQVLSQTVTVPAGQGSFGVHVPESGSLRPGDYAVSVRVQPESGSDLAVTDTARLIIPDRASLLGEAVLWRRGPSTGPRYLRTADPRFQRNERLRLELATSADGAATAQVLDRAGKPLQIPVQATVRSDPAGFRWIVVDAGLAPLAPGDYAIEVSLADAKQVTGFRMIP
jgi:hypothetical protein